MASFACDNTLVHVPKRRDPTIKRRQCSKGNIRLHLNRDKVLQALLWCAIRDTVATPYCDFNSPDMCWTSYGRPIDLGKFILPKVRSRVFDSEYPVPEDFQMINERPAKVWDANSEMLDQSVEEKSNDVDDPSVQLLEELEASIGNAAATDYDVDIGSGCKEGCRYCDAIRECSSEA